VRIEADGCALREWSDADVPAIVAGCLDPEVVRWCPNIPQPYDADHGRAFVAKARATMAAGREAQVAIVDGDDAVLGSVGLILDRNPAIAGYWIAPHARGRGVASAATGAIARHAFDSLAVARIELEIEPANIASQRVAVKAGFARVPGEVRHGVGADLWVYGRSA
jgi:RimJ/RimL family protein N-acetyltransferase